MSNEKDIQLCPKCSNSVLCVACTHAEFDLETTDQEKQQFRDWRNSLSNDRTYLTLDEYNDWKSENCTALDKINFEKWIEKNGMFLLEWLNDQMFIEMWKDIKGAQKQLADQITKKDN